MAVSNDDFLRAVFGAEFERAHVCSFAEDPKTSGRWTGGRRSGYHLVDNYNNYFAISLFKDDSDGVARRKDYLHEATYCFILDDVGTKISGELVESKLPPPSWRLETSPGNEQWGYLLDQPETDLGRAQAVITGLAAAGLTDDGAQGVGRYARLPVGRNTKGSLPETYPCRLEVPAHGLLTYYSIEDLAAAVGVTLPAPGSVQKLTPAPIATGEDCVLDLLTEWGMVHGGPSGDGWWSIECPWIDEHTDRADTGTAYKPGVGFKCHHGHCAERLRSDLVRWCEDRLQDESGGLAHVDEWDFPYVAGYVEVVDWREAAALPSLGEVTDLDGGRSFGPAGSAEAEFFAQHVLVKSEDAYLCLRGGVYVSRRMLDDEWTALLSGVLPVVAPKTGRRLEPSQWFVDESQRGRARIVEAMTYWPGAPRVFRDETGRAFVNEWRAPPRLGLAVDQDDVEPWLRLVRHITSGEGAEACRRLLDWFALVVGAPGVKPGWHVLVQSGQGLGKDMMIQPVIAGVGHGNDGKANPKSLHSDFNGWAQKRFVVVNEIKQTTRGSASGADQYNTLKEVTEHTNKWLSINRKNREPYLARNTAAFFVTSNSEEPIAIEADDRRFMVFMAGDVALWTDAEYAELAGWLNRGGLEMCAEWLHLRWEEMSAECRGKLMARAPWTKGKDALARNVEDVVQSWMREQIEDGVWPDLMTSEDIAEQIANAARLGLGGFRYPPSPKRWARFLKALGGEHVYGGEGVRVKSGERRRMWAVREPARFNGMSETAITQAYKSARGYGFVDADVVDFPQEPSR